MEQYQPTLLSLQDMLNLSEDDNDNDSNSWADNPYSIHNFFEPIVSPVKSAQQRTALSNQAGPSSSSGLSSVSGSETNQYVDPFGTPPKRKLQQSPLKTPPVRRKEEGQKQDVKVQDEDTGGDYDNFWDVDMFDESLVNDEVEKSGEEVPIEIVTIRDRRVTEKDHSQRWVQSPTKTKVVSEKGVQIKEEQATRDLGNDASDDYAVPESKAEEAPKIFLKEVKIDDPGPAKKKLAAEKLRRKNQAIHQMNSLINTLKEYSEQLREFLGTEGDLILEHYNAQTMLKGILSEVAEEDRPDQSFDVPHYITRALVGHINGRIILPPRQSHLWVTSELLLLQKAVLESAITRKEFLLNCRYTYLLAEMGFDEDDIQRLQKNPKKEMELGTLKIIMHEHEFFSKSRYSRKKPIKTVITLATPSGGCRVLVLPSPEQLVQDKWKALAEIRTRTILSTLKDEEIDWLFVLKKLWVKNPRLKVDEKACRLTYEHLISFKHNNRPWHVDELRRLLDIRDKYVNVSWEKVARRLGTNRTPFSCFVKFKAHGVSEQPSFDVFGKGINLRHAIKLYQEFKGNVTRLDHELRESYPHLAKRIPKPIVLSPYFQKTRNPRHKKGTFTVVEDALLFAVMEKYKNYIKENDGMLDPVAYALPWRPSTLWKMRFGRLLSGFYYKTWTIEEDRLLWRLVNEYGPNYKIIQRSFPHKDRKQCRYRYMQIERACQSLSLENYHLTFNFTKKGGLYIEELDKIAEYLTATIALKQSRPKRCVRETDLEFLRLRRAPREKELESYMMTFAVSVLESALQRLTEFRLVVTRKWDEIYGHVDVEESSSEFKNAMAGFDRRRFDPSCPASMASALHLRNAKLLPQEVHENLSPFEENVYNYYKYFSLRGRARGKTQRDAIPPLDTLRKFTSISRLIEDPTKTQNEPCIIMEMGKANTEEKRKQEELEALREIELKKIGGRMKGTKRKKMTTRETRRKAAMMRWEKKKLLENQDENCASGVGSPWDGDSDYACPTTPATPLSVASLSTGEGNEGNSDSVPKWGAELKKATIGMIADHAYILPMEMPSGLSELSLTQLLEKLGQKPVTQKLKELSVQNTGAKE